VIADGTGDIFLENSIGFDLAFGHRALQKPIHIEEFLETPST